MWFMSLASLVAPALISACMSPSSATPTELVVDIDAEPAVKARAQTLHVVVEAAVDVSDPKQLSSSLDQSVKTAKLPLRVALVPLFGSARRKLVLTATALDAKQVLVAQARLVSGYVADEVRYAHLLIEDACLDTHCAGALDTCAGGHCVPAEVDAGGLSQDPQHPTRLPASEADAGE
jgi:hypothetical protein